MILKILVGEQTYPLDVPDMMLTECEAFYAKMDADMNKGWQMSSRWVEELDQEQRCQVVADRILTAMENENKKMAIMMAGYILSRAPLVAGISINIQGEMFGHELLDAQQVQTFL